MAVKAHLRQDRPLLLALASNDALATGLGNLSKFTARRNVFFVPMAQDDPVGKPHSLVAEMERIPECLAALREGRQVRPLFV
jgi:dipicolinate synthase subunit B